MLLSKCGHCDRPIRADATRCPACLAAAGPDPPPAPKDETGYGIAMLATTCAILVYFFVIRR
jgi:hypothetical protein